MYFDARKRRPSAWPASSTGHEMRLGHLGRGPRLLLEAPAEDRVVDQLEAHDLERDDLAVGLADGLEDQAHAAFAEELLEPIRSEGLARARVHARVIRS